MRNNWLHAYKGYVKIKVTNTAADRFINECVSRGVYLWDIHYDGQDSFSANILLSDVSQLKKLARLLSCKITFTEKRGTPFVLRKVWRRKGIVAGIAAFVAGLIILSNMVWSIEIEGADPAVEQELHNALEEMGVTKGKFRPLLPPPEKIQEGLMDTIEGITWAGVTKKERATIFRVVKKEIAEEQPLPVTGHLVASRKAVIKNMFVEKGDVLVKPNQLVEKGDILVSGAIGKEDKTVYTAAEGEVTGEFWFKAEVTVPLRMTADVLSGNMTRKHYLNIRNFSLPVWGWFRGLETERVYEDTDTRKWEPFGINTRLSYSKVTEYEVLKEEEQRMKEQAANTASEKAREQLLDRLSPEAEVLGEKVLHQMVEGGKVKVSLHYRVSDNIAVKQPIIQGD